MMQTVQLSITDALYAASLREALSRNCAWHVESVERPDPSCHGVMVVDQDTFERLSLPLSNPERIVLISRKEPGLLAEAWEAGIVSVVSREDPLNTVLLAIMAAGLRVDKSRATCQSHAPTTISPSVETVPASIAPQNRISGPKRCKVP
jgi:hypothetical protein